jgi:hypothetical protein
VTVDLARYSARRTFSAWEFIALPIGFGAACRKNGIRSLFWTSQLLPAKLQHRKIITDVTFNVCLPAQGKTDPAIRRTWRRDCSKLSRNRWTE